MTSLRRFPILIATLAILASSCGQTRDPVADVAATSLPPVSEEVGDVAQPPVPTVSVIERDTSQPVATILFPDGSTTEISGEEYADIVNSLTGSERFVASVYRGQFGPTEEGYIVGQLIMREMFAYSVAEGGIEVDPNAVQSNKDQLSGELAAALVGEPDPAAAATEVASEVAPYIGALSELIANQEAISLSLADGAEGAEVENHCSRHILVDTLELAEDLMTQLDDGADFAALATEFSTDPGSGAQGGDLGCTQATDFVPPFAEALLSAELDTIVGPVESDFGFHIITVYEVKTEVIPPDTSALFEEVMGTVIGGSVVEVDPAVGLWDANSFSVIPRG